MTVKLTKQAREYLAEIGRKGGKIGGKATTKRKADAARANGHKGGRPRKDERAGRPKRKDGRG
jgi:general stress protein YciG